MNIATHRDKEEGMIDLTEERKMDILSWAETRHRGRKQRRELRSGFLMMYNGIEEWRWVHVEVLIVDARVHRVYRRRNWWDINDMTLSGLCATTGIPRREKIGSNESTKWSLWFPEMEVDVITGGFNASENEKWLNRKCDWTICELIPVSKMV